MTDVEFARVARESFAIMRRYAHVRDVQERRRLIATAFLVSGLPIVEAVKFTRSAPERADCIRDAVLFGD